MLAELWDELVPGNYLNENGLKTLKKWLRKFNANELATAMRASTDQYLSYDTDKDCFTHASVDKAWKFVPRICACRRRDKDKPHMKDLYYIRGILRNRLSYVNEWKAIKLMEAAFEVGWPNEEIKQYALEVKNWSTFRDTMETWAEGGPGDG